MAQNQWTLGGNETVRHRRLPHWRKPGATYFLTWRIRRVAAELAPEERSIVLNALRHFDGERYDLYTAVVMNDHAHAILTPHPKRALEDIMHSQKSFTSHAFQRVVGRAGETWQEEYFNRIVRTDADLQAKGEYIIGNPMKRWPTAVNYQWVHVAGERFRGS